MKLLKIGSSPSCDIVINNPYVSAHHANIIVLDNGEILIEDCGSSNGTFLGVQKSRLKPGVETPVHRGDRVMLGNEPLPWNKVPQATNRHGARMIVNIGSSQRNDVVVPGNTVSRYHAVMFVDKDGKTWIVDNKSTNGTQVNGLKIAPERPTQIRRGDNIIVGGEDVTASLEQYLPKGGKGGKVTAVIVSTAAAVAVMIALAMWLWPTPELPDSAVVLVRNVYHYDIELADNPYKLPVHMESNSYAITGTGFFIDEDGRIATNRHVACPWEEEYQEMDAFTKLKIQDELKQEWDEYLKKNIPTHVSNMDDLNRLNQTQIGSAIIEACAGGSNALRKLNQMLEKLHNTPVKITGKSDLVSVAYANRHYTSFDEFAPAVVVAESGDEAKDVAILQLNTKETPEKIMKAGILDINNISTTNPGIQKEELMFKGYPEGISRTWNEKFNVSNMVPTTYRGKCSRNDDPYKYEIQATTSHGASGSPVYYNGKLYGLVTQIYTAGDDVIIVPARWLKDLYDKNVVLYRE